MYENNRDQVEGKKTQEKENFLSAVEHREKKSHIKPDKKNKKKTKKKENSMYLQYQKAPVSVGRISTVDLHHSKQGSIMRDSPL
jgi:hypothetical protein